MVRLLLAVPSQTASSAKACQRRHMAADAEDVDVDLASTSDSEMSPFRGNKLISKTQVMEKEKKEGTRGEKKN